jgi:hypothetical protein
MTNISTQPAKQHLHSFFVDGTSKRPKQSVGSNVAAVWSVCVLLAKKQQHGGDSRLHGGSARQTGATEFFTGRCTV